MEDTQIKFMKTETYDVKKSIDLNSELVANPTSTYFFRSGLNDSVDLNVSRGDLLVVDRSRDPGHDSLIIYTNLNGLFLGKVFKRGNDTYIYRDKKYLHVDNAVQIWGVVTYVMHKV